MLCKKNFILKTRQQFVLPENELVKLPEASLLKAISAMQHCFSENEKFDNYASFQLFWGLISLT